MKIIQIIPSLQNAGGAERFVVDLTIALKRLGNEVEIIVLYKDETCFFQNDLLNENIAVTYLNKKKGFDLKNSLLLRKHILRSKPDIVHTHINSHLSMKMSFLWERKSKIRYVHTIHNVPNQECSKPFLFNIMKRVYKKKIVVPVTITKSLSDETKVYYDLEFTPPFVDNGIQVENFRSELPINSRSIDFLSVASFQPKKNQLMIVKAAHELLKEGHQFKLVLLGAGETFKLVEQYVISNNLNEHISLKGQVKNVATYMRDSKCLLLPSLFEGNPISILEAMSAGMAIIATEVGGVKDVVKDHENGYLVDPTQINPLIQNMRDLLLNTDKLSRFSTNNLDKSSTFNISTTAKSYMKIYEN